MKITKKSIRSKIKPTWCSGCGNYGILRALHAALQELELHHEEVLIIYGIGCGSNAADFSRTYGIHALHGRPIANAIGAKLANHELKVIVMAGDGGLYGEGANHLLFAARGNHNIITLVHNNWRYSLTTGQASPTTPQGTVTKSTPEGLIEKPFNPLKTALSVDATFVAQGFSNHHQQLKEIIKQAITHRGFSLVDIMQPCLALNKEQDFDWYKERIQELEDHDSQDLAAAFELSTYKEDKVLTGIYYQNEQTPAYHEQVKQIKDQTLLSQWRDQVDLSSVISVFT